MHKYFSDWYREINIEPTAEKLTKRWSAIETIMKKMNKNLLLNIICTFNHKCNCFPQFAEQFSQYFFKKDSTFSMRNNQNELKVLAAACLAELLDNSKELALITALSIMTSTFGVQHSEPPVTDIITQAENKLVLSSSITHEGVLVPKITSIAPQIETALQELKTTVVNNNLSQTQLVTPLIDELIKVEKRLISLTNQSAKYVSHSKQKIDKIGEECNILWWLFSGFSHDLDKAFKELVSNGIPIILGKELADLVSYLPGPASVKGILEKAIQNSYESQESKEDTISNVIKSLPIKWKTEISNKTQKNVKLFPCIFPLHYAISLAVELDGSKWDNAFNKKIKHLKLNDHISATSIAYMFYLESVTIPQIEIKE